MSVTIKIVLMVLIPMVGLLYFSISSVADSYQTATAVNNIQVGIRASAMVGDLVHEVQSERALSVRSEERRVGKECRSWGWPEPCIGQAEVTSTCRRREDVT